MAKKAQDLIAKRDLAMKVSNIVHWDFDVNSQKFESYNDPINDYVSDRLLTVSEYMDVIYPEDRSVFYDAMQSLIAGMSPSILPVAYKPSMMRLGSIVILWVSLSIKMKMEI